MIILGHYHVTVLLAKTLIWAPFSQLMCTSYFCINPWLLADMKAYFRTARSHIKVKHVLTNHKRGLPALKIRYILYDGHSLTCFLWLVWINIQSSSLSSLLISKWLHFFLHIFSKQHFHKQGQDKISKKSSKN